MIPSSLQHRPFRRHARTLWLLVLVVSFPGVLHAGSHAPELSASPDLARAGYFHLRWALDDVDVDRYTVEEAADPDFTDPAVLYEGADRATVISGRSDGTFHFRVRASLADGGESGWSDTQTVEVVHHPRAQAIGLFILGGLVFLATVGLIVAGTSAGRRAAGGA
ncbi:hypothetical protein [Thioalkalivibrio thiocyanodenitrificans]|uniref:hypothetical protein n=1 Tax=Thioalkalivibrio thiocyanodenitrificans TaxID=243063 RepID=UPI00037134E0|nr:hypothetical protein [Thioalkalivibrio thiocyanodenitrificans]